MGANGAAVIEMKQRWMFFTVLALSPVIAIVPAWSAARPNVADINQLLYARRDKEALRILAPLMRSDPHNATLSMLHGRALLALDRISEAVDSFRIAVADAPGNGEAYYLLGQALAQRIPQVDPLSRLALAKELRSAYGKAVLLSPRLVAAHEALMDFYLQAPGFFGGSLEKARQQAEIIATLDVAHGDRAKAVIAESQGNDVLAIKDYEEAIAKAPRDVRMRVELGALYSQAGRPGQACVMYRQSLALDPFDLAAITGLAGAARKAGDTADLKAAAAALQKVVGRVSKDTAKLLRRQYSKIQRQINLQSALS